MTSTRVAGRSRLAAVTALLLLAGLAGCGDDGAVAEPTAATEAGAEPSPDDTTTDGTTGEPTTDDTTTDDTSDDTTTDDATDAADPGTGDPELCDDLAAVRGSVETMRGATIGDGAVPVVAEELRSLETTVPELRAAAAEQYQAEVEQVEVSTAAVRSSVDAAQADTSAATVLAVTTAVRALGATVDGLVEEVGDTC